MPSIAQSRARAKDERLQAHKQDDNTYIVYNPANKSSYKVYKNAGVWICTCPFFTKGSRIQSGICKHLCRVIDREVGCTGCHKTDVRLNADRRCAPCVQLDRLGFS